MRENVGKMWTRVAPNTDTFYAMLKYFKTLKKKKKKKKKVIGTHIFELFYNVLMWVKYGHLTLLKLFSDKVNLDIDVTNEAVVQCDVPVVEIFFRCW